MVSEKHLQSYCVAWFRNEYVDSLYDNGLATAEHAKYLRMLFHGNQNELPKFLESYLSYKGKTILNSWINNLKSMGLMAGVADTSLKHPVSYEGKVYPYVEIEFKTPQKSSKQSQRQKDYEQAVTAVGGLYKIIRTPEEFKVFIGSLILIT